MQIIDYIHMRVFNSRLAGYCLMLENNKHYDFVYKMIDAKNTREHREWNCLDPEVGDYTKVENKIKQYERTLCSINIMYKNNELERAKKNTSR